ncbi:hypothetical protein NON20_15600 [Synechocystis sp. B12]|nr:hypothetical protein NON20_15600 [Synechocystis sp. B12]
MDGFVHGKTQLLLGFSPGAVMPEPIPGKILRAIKLEKGLCEEEKAWLTAAVAVSALAIGSAFLLRNPMPVVLAFAFDAVTAGRLEMEEI